MNIYPIEAGNFKLDGGAMFGVIPKSLWQRTNPSDSNNLIVPVLFTLISDINYSPLGILILFQLVYF